MWSPIFILITVTALLSFMAGQGLNSGSSVYLARVGYPSAIAGTSAFIFSIAAAVIRIVCGQVLDKRGRYGVLMIGCALFVASTLAPLLRLSSEAFLAMRVVQGVGFAMVTTTSTTMASDVLPVAHLGSGLGFFGLGQALAMSIGPAIALALVETNPPENLFIIVSVLAIGATVCSALSRYERHPERLPKTCGYRMRVESQAASQHKAATASQPDAAIASQSEATTSQSNTAASQPDAAATPQPNAAASAPEAGDSHKGKPTIGAFLAQIFEIRALCGALPMFAYAPIVGFNIYFVGLFAAEMGLPNGGFYYTLAAIGMIVVRLGSHLFMDRVQPLKILGVGLALGMISLVLLLMITLDR